MHESNIKLCIMAMSLNIIWVKTEMTYFITFQVCGARTKLVPLVTFDIMFKALITNSNGILLHCEMS